MNTTTTIALLTTALICTPNTPTQPPQPECTLLQAFTTNCQYQPEQPHA